MVGGHWSVIDDPVVDAPYRIVDSEQLEWWEPEEAISMTESWREHLKRVAARY